ncbi:hypothetical protein ACFC96_00350 [Streptomyces sp. NPDC055955]|uniref:hypothetical protein n=1 Tax=Streptomyces sp. NPDC055955 TaxID=3345665 RepID=UPI0035D9CE1B
MSSSGTRPTPDRSWTPTHRTTTNTAPAEPATNYRQAPTNSLLRFNKNITPESAAPEH